MALGVGQKISYIHVVFPLVAQQSLWPSNPRESRPSLGLPLVRPTFLLSRARMRDSDWHTRVMPQWRNPRGATLATPTNGGLTETGR
jgi:hypothetical protein